MGKVVNLRRFARRRARAASRGEADANAARHGEAGFARRRRKAQAALEDRRFDGHQQHDDSEET